MRKVLLSLLLLALMSSMAYAAVGDTFSYVNLRYEVLSENELTVTCLGPDSGSSGNNGYYLFQPTVERNGKVYSVTEIADYAFPSGKGVIDFTSFPPYDYKVKRIGKEAIRYCNIDPATLPPSLEYLGDSNFCNREDITSLTLPSRLKYIGSSCFTFCTKLKSIKFNYALEEIGSDAFLECKALTDISIPHLNILGLGAFQACTNIKSFNLPEGLTEIRGQAFNYCSSLSTIIIPSTVTKMEDMVFRNCFGLKQVIYTSPSEPSLVKFDGTPLAIEEVFDNVWGNVDIYVPDRTAYSFGTQMISFDGREYVYNGKTPEIEWANNTPWPVSINLSQLNKNAGEYNIQIAAVFSAPLNHTINIPLKYTIAKAPLSINIDSQSIVYGSMPPVFSAQFSGFVNDESLSNLYPGLSYICDAQYGSNAGEYSITGTFEDKNYYASTITPGKFTVAKAPLVVIPSPITREYGDDNPTIPIRYEGFRCGDVSIDLISPFIFTTEATKESPVGSYEIFISGGECQNYYFSEYVSTSITVNKAVAKIIADNCSRIYGDPNPEVSYHFGNLKLGQTDVELTKDVTIGALPSINAEAGSYSITLSGAESQNYDFDYTEKGKLTILKAPISIKVNNASKEYGDENPIWQFSYTGLKCGDSDPGLYRPPTISCEANAYSDVGTYDVIASDAETTNYSITEYIPGILTVTKAPLKIKALDTSRLYGDSNPEFDVEFIGLKTPHELQDESNIIFLSPFTVSSNAEAKSHCGDYSIIVSGGECLNYEITDRLSGILSIMKRNLYAKPMAATRFYGEENPLFEISYEGFVNGDNKYSLISEPVAETDASVASDPGIYEIYIQGGKSNNYEFVYHTNELVIKHITLSFAQDSYTVVYDGEQHWPSYDSDGPMNDEVAHGMTKISKEVYLPELHAYSFMEVSEIRDAGNYKLEMIEAKGSYQACSFADFKVEKATAVCSISNDLTNLKVGDEIVLDWECNDPEATLRCGMIGGPIELKEFEDIVDGVSTTRYKIVSKYEGEGNITIYVDCSPNYTCNNIVLPYKVSPSAGVNDIVSDNDIHVTRQNMRIFISGKTPNDIVRVFNSSGVMLYMGNDSDIEIGSHGIYLVVVQNKSFKIKL